MSAVQHVGGGHQPVLDLVTREIERATYTHNGRVFDLPLSGDLGIMEQVVMQQLRARLGRLLTARDERTTYDTEGAVIEQGMMTATEAQVWEATIGQMAELIVGATPPYLRCMSPVEFSELGKSHRYLLVQAFQEAGQGIAAVLTRRALAEQAAQQEATEPTPITTKTTKTKRPTKQRASTPTGGRSSRVSAASTGEDNANGSGTPP